MISSPSGACVDGLTSSRKRNIVFAALQAIPVGSHAFEICSKESGAESSSLLCHLFVPFRLWRMQADVVLA
jgi:hypothetical protein